MPLSSTGKILLAVLGILLVVAGVFWIHHFASARRAGGWQAIPAPQTTSEDVDAAVAQRAKSASPAEKTRLREKARWLKAILDKLPVLHKPIPKPGPSDWLANHAEPGQTFQQYVDGDQTLPTKKRRFIYIQPLGDFTPTQRDIIDRAAKFIEMYFNLPVRTLGDLPLSVVPDEARRKNPHSRQEQILTTHVLDKVLRPRLPDDAMVLIAFTPTDLWPGKGWNFVFGQAALSARVGVWSISRFGNPDAGPAALKRCLLRTLKLATHETGHMFGMYHCTRYLCNMCGSNHLKETDRLPLWLCPECMAKVCFATGADPTARYKKLAEYTREQGLIEAAEFYELSKAALEGEQSSKTAQPGQPDTSAGTRRKDAHRSMD